MGENMSEFIPNIYQQVVFDFIKNEADHGVVVADAGTGKTTLIIEALKLLPSVNRTAFVAFNKHIADELAQKSPHGVQTMTLHSMGLKAITSAYGRPKVEGSKVYKLMNAATAKMSWEEKRPIIAPGMNIISLLKGNLLAPAKENIQNLACYHDIDIPDTEKFYKIVEKVFRQSANDTNTIDFDDMVYFPAEDDLPCTKYDYLFVDEAQDLNPAQLKLVLNSIKPEGRIIAVGDPKQSIYGFRGADVNSIPKIIGSLNAKVMPLSISYRCPISHVENANKFAPDMQAAPGAKQGTIKSIDYLTFDDLVAEDDLILCRFNAPLVAPCLNLIKQGRKATIRGKDIGKNLATLIKNLRGHNMQDLEHKLEKWQVKELQKAQAKNMNPQAIEDKYETIQALIEFSEARSPAGLVDYIKNLFSDEKAEIVFSSIHKAKGLESKAVFILEPYLMPCKFATQPWEMEQERNIEYVAITRSKDALYYVS